MSQQNLGWFRMLNKIKDRIEKATIAVATIKENKLHNIVIKHAKVGDNKIIITDNYMKTTLENIKKNPNISLVFWHGEKGWRINGRAEYYNSGEWLESVKFVNVKEVKELS